MKEAEKRKEDAEAQRAGVPAPKRTAASPKCHQPFHYRLRHHSNTVPASPHRAPIVVAFIIIVSNRTNQPLHLCPTSPLSISFVTTIIEPSSSTSSRYRFIEVQDPKEISALFLFFFDIEKETTKRAWFMACAEPSLLGLSSVDPTHIAAANSGQFGQTEVI